MVTDINSLSFLARLGLESGARTLRVQRAGHLVGAGSGFARQNKAPAKRWRACRAAGIVAAAHNLRMPHRLLSTTRAPNPAPLFDVAATRRIEAAAAAALPPHTLMQRAGLATARLAKLQ